MILTFQWPWAILIALVVAALVLWLASALSGRGLDRQPQVEAFHLADDLKGEHASHLMRIWRAWNRVAAVLLALALVVALVMAGRPSSVDKSDETTGNRDIVLCLDVSGSTLPYDNEVIETYLKLVKHFEGERIGLSIFNSTSRTVFPLTDDYDLVQQQLENASTILKGVETQDDIDALTDAQYQAVSDWLDGTQNKNNATSLIGDGLVSCAAMLPGFTYSSGQSEGADREASIVLATDNVVSGTETYTLQQALDLTSQAGITVDGLYSGPSSSEDDQTTKDMESEIESHGGVFLTQSDGTSVDALVREIDKRQVASVEKHSQAAVVDAPGWWTLGIAVLLAGWLVVAWRLKR
ncbi:VWA domain-containing protein [Bifidobacterium choloepi]|uniref:VWA domain-containing protein n=1 Tax=Bifidobacterium choloepi TaxID=2614131 RepID=A0A6I5MXR2_9BIFI|nr:VWA domain-containing protein [Bifidobacterium choloepi]NEG69378.1 VWA domain-containing protein [Bifidobacterium choloepi]